MKEAEVILARSAGFCFGVHRAVDTVYERTGMENVYTYGPIIHNDEVVKDLESKGVKAISDVAQLDGIDNATVIIRSHGVSKNVYESIKTKNYEVVDATCPFVLKIHRIVEQESKAGKQIVIIGNEKHPEVEGIKGWSVSPVYIVDSIEKAQNLELDRAKEVVVVSQTTFNYNKFQELVEIINKKSYNITIKNTICNATEERQTEARDIARKVSAMIVIGDKSSSNTRKLYEICKGECEDTFYIQTLRDLNLNDLRFIDSIGITAGASTPKKIIEEVHTRMAEQSFAELLKEEEESTKPIRTGEIVTGQVIEVNKDEIILSIAGNKSEGVITRDEYSNDNSVDLTTKVQVGEEMEAKVIKLNDGVGMVSLSYKRMAADRGNKRLEEAFENQEVLTAKVAQVLDGGLSVLVEEARALK